MRPAQADDHASGLILIRTKTQDSAEGRLPPAEPHRAGEWRGILHNAGWMLGGKAIGAILSLVYLGLATRTLGPVAFGQFVLVLGTGQLVAIMVSFETWQLLLRYGMDRLKEGNRHALGRLFAFCTMLDLCGAMLGAALSLVAVVALAPRYGWSPTVEREAVLFCLVLLASVRSASIGVMRLHDRFAAAAFAETVTPVVRLIGALIAIGTGATVRGLLIAWAVAELATAAAHWIIALRLIRPSLAWWRWSALRAVPREYSGFWRYAAIVNMGSTLGLVSRQFAALLVGATVSPAAAGGYRIAHQLGVALANISDMLSRATFAELMRARASTNAAELAPLFRKAALIAAITGAIIVTLLLLLGRPALTLLAGHQYADVYPLLLILGIAAAVDAAGVAFEPALLAAGRAWLALRLRLFATVFLLVALIVLLRHAGTVGAALATLLTSCLTLSLLGIVAWRAIHAPVERQQGSDLRAQSGARSDDRDEPIPGVDTLAI